MPVRLFLSDLSVKRRPADGSLLDLLADALAGAASPLDALAGTTNPLPDQLIAALTAYLHRQAAARSNEQVSALMRLIRRLDEQREAAELAASPERQAGLLRIRSRWAHQAA